jgi:hypothetical protein
MTRKERGWAATSAAGVLLWVAASIVPGGAVPAHAAGGIAWEKHGGAFQACLDDKAKAWIAAKVELVVNEDPDMGAIDDATVAQWATQALKECADKAAGADPASELQFMRHMSRWRDHIYAAASEIRGRARPD